MNQRFKIVKTKPDKNGAVIIAIKADEHGEFTSRGEALEFLHNQSNKKEGDVNVL